MLGADITAALPELRRETESLMTTTVRVETVTVTADPTTGADVVTPTSLVYSGPAKVKGSAAAADAVPATVATERIHFPALGAVIPVGSRITVEDSTNQPNLVGLVYRVTRSHLAEFQTAQRVEVESWQ